MPVVADAPLVGAIVVELVPALSWVAPSLSPTLALTVMPESSPQAIKR